MSAKANILVDNDFSTEIGYLKPFEHEFRNEICLNGQWDFQPVELSDGFETGESIPELSPPIYDQWEDIKLKIPSPWNINGLVDEDGVSGGDFVCFPSYPESWKHVKMGWMKRTLHVPEDWQDNTILLHFEAVCGYCEVFIDGQKVGEHFDSSMPETYLIDEFVSPGKDHELWVGVRAPELMNVNKSSTKFTYPTGSFFNMKSAGIWQDVFLLGVPRVCIKDVYVQPDVSADQLRLQVTIENRSGQSADLTVNSVVKALKPFTFPDDGIRVVPHYDLQDDAVMEFPSSKIEVAPDSEVVITLETSVSGELIHWDMDNPSLYAALVSLGLDGQTIDRKYERFGWREFTIKGSDFFLNGTKIQIKGDSWHFMGITQMTRRYAFAWYTAVKDAGGNGVRHHAMPYPTFYLEVADEMGICILDESAIWASHCRFNHAEAITWERFYEHVRRLVLRDRNYPSVIGWSVENEIRMALATHSPSKETVQFIREKSCKLMEIARELDSTRDWISADGSHDWGGCFPTSMIHYAGEDTYESYKEEIGKPVGVGEGTIAYYGTPVHAAEFAGDIAFQSVEDRMKGVAVQSYGNLEAQISAGFSYVSVFNLAWYGLQPLPLGHANQENAPTVENGIIFGEYREGKPGVQPERLGPYCSTFNPGYDPYLPLYSPWPMYEAIKSAYAPDGPLPSPYDKVWDTPAQKLMPPVKQAEKVTFIGGKNSVYYRGLQESGIQFREDQTGTLLFADLTSISAEQETALKSHFEVLKSDGGTIVLSGLTRESEDLLENLIGQKVEIFEREASSLVFAGEYANTDPVVDHFRLSELYFSEDEDYIIQKYGIRRDGLENTKGLLKACSCEWRSWNYRAEPVKTGAVYRSEKELPEAHTLLEFKVGQAKLIVCAIEMVCNPTSAALRLSSAKKVLWNKLMKAFGADVSDDFGKEAPVLLGGKVIRTLAVGFLPAHHTVALLDDDFLNGEGSVEPRQGEVVIRYGFSAFWQVKKAVQNGFDLKNMMFNGDEENSASYMSFYLNSPRRIDDLLSEPNVPELYLNMETACSIRVWLNGEAIFTQSDVSARAVKLQTRLLLGMGSNHILIKVVNVKTDYVVKLHLSSTHEDYIGKLTGSVER